jgi:hypothetical protein
MAVKTTARPEPAPRAPAAEPDALAASVETQLDAARQVLAELQRGESKIDDDEESALAVLSQGNPPGGAIDAATEVLRNLPGRKAARSVQLMAATAEVERLEAAQREVYRRRHAAQLAPAVREVLAAEGAVEEATRDLVAAALRVIDARHHLGEVAALAKLPAAPGLAHPTRGQLLSGERVTSSVEIGWIMSELRPVYGGHLGPLRLDRPLPGGLVSHVATQVRTLIGAFDDA